MQLAKILGWFAAHWEVAWPIVSAVLVAVMRSRTPEAWVAMGERHPRAQGAIKLLRALGLDPVKAAHAVGQIVSGRVAATTTPTQRERADVLASVIVADAPAPDASPAFRPAGAASSPHPTPSGAGAAATDSSHDGGST